MLKNLDKFCGVRKSPGTLITFYYTCTCELNGYPVTRAVNGGVAAGDTKILDAPFDFSTAPAGEGYWREAQGLIDTGKVNDLLQGEVGGQGFDNMFSIFIEGTAAAQLEWADDMVAHSGCLMFLVPDRNGNFRCLGHPDQPVVVEPGVDISTGEKNGDRVGGQWTFKCPSGVTAPIYDATTHGIDITPNV